MLAEGEFFGEVEDVLLELGVGGFFGTPAGDEDEVMAGADLVSDFDEDSANEATDVVALVGLAGLFGGDEGVAEVVEIGLGESGENEVLTGGRLPFFAHSLEVGAVVEGEFAGKFHAITRSELATKKPERSNHPGS